MIRCPYCNTTFFSLLPTGKCPSCGKKLNEEKALKPCPFCGGKAELHTDPWSTVMCTKCKAMSNFFMHSGEYISADKAIEAWNRRTSNE